MSELKMTHYQGDSAVDAAILYDYGYFNVHDRKFNYLRRIKIFTREGLGHLIFEIPVESKGFFNGFVVNAVDGRIEKERISNDHIYIERSGGYSRVRVAPPNVREGSVVDIAFTTSGHPSIWQFQHKIPVRYSELYIPGNENFSFSFSQIGYEDVEEVKKGRYIARDMPAFKPEPYIDSENNYMTSMLIDLQSVHINHARGMLYKEVSTNWKTVNDFFVEGVRYYDLLKEPCLFLGDVVEDIRISSEDTLQRITRALQALHEHISWDENTGMYPGETLKEAWDKGTGNSADMNFIFLCMMRKLDVEAYPVLSSIRSR
jgi:hypothetical protein